MADLICHSFRSLVRPHDYHHSGLRTDGQGRTERVVERGRCLRTILRAVCGDGGGLRRGPRTTTSFGPQRELPPARLVIHLQTSAQNNVGDAGSSDEVGHISGFLHPASLVVDNGRAPHSGAHHEEDDAWKGGRYSPVHRVLGSEPRGLRTHRRCGRSRPLRGAVVEYQTPSVAV